MQEKLTYINSRGEKIEFGTNSIFHVNISKDASGLTDTRNEIYKSNSVGQHGDTELGARIEARDIELTGAIKCIEKEKSLEYRRMLARVLNPSLKGTLVYEVGNFKRVIQARPENAPSMGKREVLMTFDVQFYCASPFWQEEIESKDEIAAWVACFEFDSEIPMEDGMIFAYREPSVIVNCYNEGDVATGMRIELKAQGTVETPQILNLDTREFIQINTTLQAGDVIEVNTEYGNKGVKLVRDGKKVDYFRYLDIDSTFMQLDIADNMLRYGAESGVDSLEVSIYHANKYLGV